MFCPVYATLQTPSSSMARRGAVDVPTPADDKEVPEALEGAADRDRSHEKDRDRANERRGEGDRGAERERGKSDERDRDGGAGNEHVAKEDERRSEEKEKEKEKDGAAERKSEATPGGGVPRGEVPSPWHLRL